MFFSFLGSENIVLHRFPNPDTDIERFDAWTDAIGGDILFMEKSSVYRLYRICHLHFESNFQSGSGRVTSNAVPTLALSGKILIPQITIMKKVMQKGPHRHLHFMNHHLH